VLNITPDHMDRYPSLADYAAAKARIFHGDGVMLLNAEDPQVMAMQDPKRRTRYFGLGPPQGEADYGIVQRGGEAGLARGERALLPCSEVPLPGRHNLANTLAAMAAWRKRWRVPFDAMLVPSVITKACAIVPNRWPSAMACAGSTIPRAPM